MSDEPVPPLRRFRERVTARIAPHFWWPAWAIALVVFIAYLALSLARWHRMSSPSWDLAIFEEAIKGYAHFGAPIVDIKGVGFNQLGDHFSPLLVIIAPFYALFPSAVTLLVAQCALVAISIIPIAGLARRRLGAPAGAMLGAAYGISWGLQSGVDVQFHEYCIAVPILAFGLTALVDGRWRSAAIWTVLLLGVKEDLGFNVLVIGLIMVGGGFFRRRRLRARMGAAESSDPERFDGDDADTEVSDVERHDADSAMVDATDADALADAERQFKIGAIVTAIGVVAPLLILFVIVPSFSPDGQWQYWQRLDGENNTTVGMSQRGVEILTTIPALLASLLTPASKVVTLVMCGAVTIGSAAVSWLTLIALPTLLWRFISPNEGYWGTTWHYSLILMPILFAAMIDALSKFRVSLSPAVRRYGRLVPPLALAFGLISCASYPLGDLVKPETYADNPRAQEAEAVMALMPAGTSVAADTGLITYLVADHTVYWIGPLDDGVVPDFVVIDPTVGWSSDPGDPAQLAEGYYPGADFETIYSTAQSGDATSYRLAQHID
ncbi:MAG: DUF2079 domain-containing protein [Propionibacteriaceae bacterium]|nr:DUF2079 domain-containing protein [Propionibacteriaceae bacterium]